MRCTDWFKALRAIPGARVGSVLKGWERGILSGSRNGVINSREAADILLLSTENS